MKKKILSELETKLNGHPYEHRFLEEMEAHLHDMEADGRVPDSLGDATTIYQHFMKTMHPWRVVYFFSEALFVGLLMAPLSFFAIPLMGPWIDFFNGSPYSTFWMIGGPLFLNAIWFIFYGLAWLRWAKIRPTTGLPFLLWSFIIVGLNQFFLATNFLSFLRSAGVGTELRNLGVILGLCLMNLSMAILAHVKTRGARTNDRKPAPAKSGRIVGHIFFVYMLCFITLRSFSELPILHAFFSPVGFVYFFGYFFWSLLSNIASGEFVFAQLTIFSLGFILIFVVVHTVFEAYQHRTWSSWKAGIALCAMSFLFFQAPAPDSALHFEMPYTSVSKSLEQQQMGIFYRLMRTLNADEGQLFRYRVRFENDTMMLQQNSGFEFRLNPAELNVSKAIREAQHLQTLDHPNWTPHADVICKSAEPYASADWLWCNELYFKNQLVFSADYPQQVTDFAVSANGHWLVLVITEGAYDPEHVYLIEDRS